MKGLNKFKLSPEQSSLLPLAFRLIYFKELPEDERKPMTYRIDKHLSDVVVTKAFEKPVSKM